MCHGDDVAAAMRFQQAHDRALDPRHHVDEAFAARHALMRGRMPKAVECAAARLAAPAALLGVMIAEWLATGYGLGGLLNYYYREAT